MKNLLFARAAFILVVFFSSQANAQSMSPEMRELCARAETATFTPLPASLSSPHPDPLYRAIETGAGKNEVKALLGNRHPDSIVINQLTPLAAAALAGNWPAAQALIESGSDVNYSGPLESVTPLMAALFTPNYKLACKLISNKAKLPSVRAEKVHLFSLARVSEPNAHADAAVFVEFLLTNGFDANDDGGKKETPLMGAVSLSNVPVIKVLLKYGARLDAVTKDGRTVWTVAEKKNNPEVLKILSDAQKSAATSMKQGAPVHSGR